jgi:hypothetical protein
MIFIFGQSEKGMLCRPTLCKNVLELFYQFGHPPAMSQGLNFAIHALLLHKPCVFFRVEEEGFSTNDYLKGLELLKNEWEGIDLHAIGLPGVGHSDIIEKTEHLWRKRRPLILLNDKDLFDYLTR